MKRLAATLALLVALAGDAPAATYWVSPTGSAGASGADSTTNAKTLAWFNANAAPGDICRFKSGAYSDPINPISRTTTATSRISYYGFPQDPQGVRVANIQLGEDAGRWGNYITVRWVKTTSAFSGIYGATQDQNPVGDSLVNCISSVANSIRLMGRYHVLDSLNLSGSITTTGGSNYWFNIAGYYESLKDGLAKNLCPLGPSGHIRKPAVANTIKNSTFSFTKHGTAGETMMFHVTAADSLVFFNNTVSFEYAESAGGYFFVFGLYNTRYAWVQGNTITATMTEENIGTRGGFMCRDFTIGSRFFNNTFAVAGDFTLDAMRPSDAGSCPATCERNYYGFNTIKAHAPQNAAFFYQSGAVGDTVVNNTIATDATQPAFAILANSAIPFRDMLLSHNVFYTGGQTAVSTMGTSVPQGANRFAGNVYYVLGVPDADDAILEYGQGPDADSAGVFFSADSTASASYAINPGTGARAPSGTQQVWGTPAFSDSTYATLDARVTSTFATGSEWNDGFAGIGQGLADQTAPALTVSFPSDTTYLWTAYETMNVAWTAIDAVGVTGIDLAWGSGYTPSSYSDIVLATANDGTYAWSLPAFSTGYNRLRVRARDAAGNIQEVVVLFRANATSGEFPTTERDIP